MLEVLRQPLEDGLIHVNRANASYSYPAQFTLVAAMNPCPCGYLTDPDKQCICSVHQINNYAARLSGPLSDRIDISIEVPKVETSEFKIGTQQTHGESSRTILSRVQSARQIQLLRFHGSSLTYNSEMGTNDINKFCQLDETSHALLQQAVTAMDLSARAYYRILKLSRSIADLA